ncbi:hypothetical protein F4781DRAFT_153828 [Annulohypoxylon bovei var. microspora]|nr:hypothetical protein F4781DRAFT_153828 [Annulohypoxylon bovei var. microspora]
MVLRTTNHATDVARLVTLAVTALRAAALLAARVSVVAAVAVVAPRNATSVARLATSHATALMPTVLTATEASAATLAMAVVKAVKAAKAARVVARRVTLAVATATCLASVSMVASATTVVRMVTSLAIAPRLLLEVRRSAISASSLDTSSLSAPTKQIYDSAPRLLSNATIRYFISQHRLPPTVYEGGWRPRPLEKVARAVDDWDGGPSSQHIRQKTPCIFSSLWLTLRVGRSLWQVAIW